MDFDFKFCVRVFNGRGEAGKPGSNQYEIYFNMSDAASGTDVVSALQCCSQIRMLISSLPSRVG